jgi:hypothetical protein
VQKTGTLPGFTFFYQKKAKKHSFYAFFPEAVLKLQFLDQVHLANSIRSRSIVDFCSYLMLKSRGEKLQEPVQN